MVSKAGTVECRHRIALLGATLAQVFAVRAVDARTWHVLPDSTGDAPTIQAAIDSARAGDEILLAPGVYRRSSQGDNGNRFNPSMVTVKAGLTLRGEGGAESAILDAESGGGRGARVIWCPDAGEVRIEGLTLTGGIGGTDYGGGGIAAMPSALPFISNCIVV